MKGKGERWGDKRDWGGDGEDVKRVMKASALDNNKNTLISHFGCWRRYLAVHKMLT